MGLAFTLAVGDVARQNAVTYARLLQGRSQTGAKAPEKPADPIIVHPDVCKNLLAAKAFSEGARALAVLVGLGIDRAAHHPDANVRQEAEDFTAPVTPVGEGLFHDAGVLIRQSP